VVSDHSAVTISTPAQKVPVRTCIVTRTEHYADEMIRFVMSPEGAAVPDIRRKLPGRGVWVTASSEIVRQAVRKRAFDRGFKQSVRADQELAVQLDNLLADDALQFLSFANKAGGVITGSAKIETALDKQPVVGLVHARDARVDGAQKLDRLLRRRFGEPARRMVHSDVFTSAQLDLALGRTNVVHVALLAVPANEAFLKRLHRLEQYRRDGEPASVKDPKATQSLLANHGAAAQETGLETAPPQSIDVRALPKDPKTHE
jgi:uncharacterized protein